MPNFQFLISKKKVLGFTFIELVVAISILMVISVSGTVYLNKFVNNQHLDKARTEVESLIKMSQNFAKIKQRPVGYLNEVLYVRLQKLLLGNIEADVNGVGETYFSETIKENDLTIIFDSIYFGGGTGKLVTADGVFYGPNEKKQIIISLNQDVAQTRTIIINSLGGVE